MHWPALAVRQAVSLHGRVGVRCGENADALSDAVS